MRSVDELLAFDFYGNLLTERMRNTMDMYLNDDMSLSEIADSENISRQGVHDTVKRAEKLLEEYEEKLGLVERFKTERIKVEKAIKFLDMGDTEAARRLLSEIKNDLITE